jgi:hypothetical protein
MTPARRGYTDEELLALCDTDAAQVVLLLSLMKWIAAGNLSPREISQDVFGVSGV